MCDAASNRSEFRELRRLENFSFQPQLFGHVEEEQQARGVPSSSKPMDWLTTS